MYTQTNVGLLCFVGSGSNVAVPLGLETALQITAYRNDMPFLFRVLSRGLTRPLGRVMCLEVKQVR